MSRLEDMFIHTVDLVERMERDTIAIIATIDLILEIVLDLDLVLDIIIITVFVLVKMSFLVRSLYRTIPIGLNTFRAVNVRCFADASEEKAVGSFLASNR